MSTRHPLLMSEGQIGSLTLRNRILHAPMARGMSNRDGSITQTHIDFLEARARGGAALVSTEGTYVDALGNSHAPALGIHSDEMIPGLARAAVAVHRHGARFAIELFYAGRVGRQWVPFRQPLAPAAVPSYANTPPSYPREMTRDDIDGLVDSFERAAGRAIAAGADALWIHGGHGYLLSAFMSPFTNTRTDEFGGSFMNRATVPTRIVAAVRRAAGAHVPILYRMNAEDFYPGGITLEESCQLAPLLAAAGVDLIDVTGGLYESKQFTMQDAAAPPAGFVPNALQIKEALGASARVSAVQKLNDPDVAERALEQGLDFVSMARGFHADPDFVEKVRAGRTREIVPCIACLRCLDLHGTPGSSVQCSSNPVTGFERRRRERRADVGRRIVVIGGGVAGMDAAARLARQGHEVSLHEASGELGGQLLLARRGMPDYQKLVDYLSAELSGLDVEVVLDNPIDVEQVDALRPVPDLVVVATGVKPGPWFWTIDPDVNTFNLPEAYARPSGQWTERVLLIGADSRSCALALDLAALGAAVDIVEPRILIAHDVHPATRARLTDRLQGCGTITVHLESTVEAVADRRPTLQSRNEWREIEPVDTVVIGEVVANNDLYEKLLRDESVFEVHAIGDCTYPRDIYAATQSSAELAERVLLGSMVVARTPATTAS
jgi:2,4-dienoyl-CoA reductase-like NADH-dependent reductase (Old Yellow Enzyme family)/NADPH-dependent 2,4-dienoyl-CoA reductase/sulfur reductase-like enzyme